LIIKVLLLVNLHGCPLGLFSTMLRVKKDRVLLEELMYWIKRSNDCVLKILYNQLWERIYPIGTSENRGILQNLYEEDTQLGIRKATENIREKCQRTLVLIGFAELKNKKTSEKLRISRPKVETQISKTLRRLKSKKVIPFALVLWIFFYKNGFYFTSVPSLLNKFIESRMSLKQEKALFEYEAFTLLENVDEIFKNNIEDSKVKRDTYPGIKKNIETTNRTWVRFSVSKAILLGVKVSVYFVTNHIYDKKPTNSYMTISYGPT